MIGKWFGNWFGKWFSHQTPPSPPSYTWIVGDVVSCLTERRILTSQISSPVIGFTVEQNLINIQTESKIENFLAAVLLLNFNAELLILMLERGDE